MLVWCWWKWHTEDTCSACLDNRGAKDNCVIRHWLVSVITLGLLGGLHQVTRVVHTLFPTRVSPSASECVNVLHEITGADSGVLLSSVPL